MELGIYKVIGYNETECVSVILEGSTYTECIKEMKQHKLGKNEFFNILDTKLLESWSFVNGEEVKDLYEYFGIE